jgi:hypothetical protein
LEQRQQQQKPNHTEARSQAGKAAESCLRGALNFEVIRISHASTIKDIQKSKKFQLQKSNKSE